MEDSRSTCRCCNQLHADTQSIFNKNLLDSEMVGIDVMLRAITSLKIEQNDGLPHCICLHCNSILITAYGFRERVIGVAQGYQNIEQVVFKRESAVDIEEVHGGEEEPDHEEDAEIGGDDNQDEDDSAEEEDDEEQESEPAKTKRNRKGKRVTYSCTICRKQYNRNDWCKRHLRTHLKEKLIRCPTCPCGFHRLDHLRQHVCRKDMNALCCNHCNRRYTTQSQLDAHMETHTTEIAQNILTTDDLRNWRQYFERAEGVTAKALGEADVVHEEPDKMYMCIICQKVLNRLDSFKKHLLSHVKDRPHACEKCTRGFRMREQLQAHRALCDGSRTLACDVCNKGFADQHMLDVHLSLHKDEPPATLTLADIADPNDYYIKVNRCDEGDENIIKTTTVQEETEDDAEYKPERTVNQSKAKRRTRQTRAAKSPITCPLCDVHFTSISQLEAHGSSAHEKEKFHLLHSLNLKKQPNKEGEESSSNDEEDEEGIKRKKFECERCLKRFSNASLLKVHARQHMGEAQYVCRKCKTPLETQAQLVKHMRSHEPTKQKYLCSECGQGFTRNTYFIVHMRRHRGEKPYICKFCGKGFPRTTDLSVHERYHTGDRPHLCVTCGRRFTRLYNLTVHIRTHTGEKPYKCTHCDSAFAQSNDLKAHIRRHTGERFSCNLCAETFVMSYALTQHKRNVHGLTIETKCGRLNFSSKLNESV